MVEKTDMTAGCHPDRLLSPPQPVLTLLEACRALSTTAAELREIVLQDPGLCARVLRAASRSCPEHLDPAAPVTSALAVLGRPALEGLALRAAQTLLANPLDNEQARFLRQLQLFSRTGGELCRSLAEAAGYPAPEEARVTGMLLNLGILTLFSCHPARYPRELGAQPGNAEALTEEQARFAVDHLQLAAVLVGEWGLDSFMADALRLLQLAPEACREAPQLVRIARLVRELCPSPLESAAGCETLATQLLGTDGTALAAVCRRAAERCRLLASAADSETDVVEQEERSRRNLTVLVFSLAAQQGICTQLAEAGDRAGLLAAAHNLYLRGAPVRDAFFFLSSGSRGEFVGQPVPGQPRRLKALATSREGKNLLAAALRSGRMCYSFATPAAAAVFDRQLAELCGSAGIAVLPLGEGSPPLGAVVLGLDSAAEVEALDSPGLLQLGRELAARLESPAAPAVHRASARPERSPLNKIAHEIRTPLAIINNYMSALHLLLEGSENAGVVGAVETEIRRIGEILSYYTEAGKAPAGTDQAPSPAALAMAAIESLAPTHFAPKNLNIRTDFDPDIAPLPANPVAVSQILVNLLKNAAEALPAGGRIEVAIREYLTSSEERQVVISIQDNGPGIAPEILERFFSPVASTKGEGHAGLGLHIVKGLADDIGARVACRSTPGQGACFELRIPRHAAHDDATTDKDGN